MLPPMHLGGEIIFYDGDCGLCHGFVKFVALHDRRPQPFLFAPLQGSTLESEVSEQRRAGLPDSVVILTVSGNLLTRWPAVAHVLPRMGGKWAVIGKMARLVPDALGNLGYDLAAGMRKRLFRKPQGACPTVPPELRSRFLP